MTTTASQTTTEINLETLLPWGEPKEVKTSAGPRLLRKATPTEAFWNLWRNPQAKQALKSAGISVGQAWKQPEGTWEACWWLPVSKETVAKQNANVEASKASKANIEIPSPKGMEFMPFQKAGILFMLRAFEDID